MIPLPSKPKVVEKKGENSVVFKVESLYTGYGTTVGNSLRRVLLSSLGGAAVSRVKIEGVSHEFSTIPGVMEDVITVILNLKELRFRVHEDQPQTVKLNVEGEKEIKGSDITTPTQVELVNPECHIATITDKKASLNMELTIEKGTGYSSAEDRKEEKLEVGQLIVDSIFTPVRKANFYVESMRVGKRTDFDRLFLEIETDGTISPEEAFLQAVDILGKHFSALSSFDSGEEEEKEEKKEVEKKDEAKEDKEDDVGEIKVEDLNISARNKKILQEAKVKTVKGILRKGEEGLTSIKGMGEKGVEEIKKALKKKGAEL